MAVMAVVGQHVGRPSQQIVRAYHGQFPPHNSNPPNSQSQPRTSGAHGVGFAARKCIGIWWVNISVLTACANSCCTCAVYGSVMMLSTKSGGPLKNCADTICVPPPLYPCGSFSPKENAVRIGGIVISPCESADGAKKRMHSAPKMAMLVCFCVKEFIARS